jgi:hypothetical protein
LSNASYRKEKIKEDFGSNGTPKIQMLFEKHKNLTKGEKLGCKLENNQCNFFV